MTVGYCHPESEIVSLSFLLVEVSNQIVFLVQW